MSAEHDKLPSDPARPEPLLSEPVVPDPANGQGSVPVEIPPVEAVPERRPGSAQQVAVGPPPVPAVSDRVQPADGRKPRTAPAATDKGKDAPPEVKDGFREVVETVVFVVVLVLMLKAFLAEAFVIPTGSMATTLFGYHQNVQCPACGISFPLNTSSQHDVEAQHPAEVTGATCPNCFLPFQLSKEGQ
ncbi:MAG: hypothetical protein L0Z62_42195 [Gemmataceae bacterium]|nr:hypothetical protein [Gemmataceae bacterium]